MRPFSTLCAALSLLCAPGAAELQIGVGIADATGPIADVIFMGMANSKQKGEGLHFRLRSRAFIAVDTETNKRFVQVSLDAGMAGIVLKKRVIAGLAKKLPAGLYTDANVAVSGTHTHSGPSGFLEDTIFQFAGSGWVPQTIDCYVNGVVESIVRAHNQIQPATASLAEGKVHGANINRSPTAYLNNPAEERAAYPDGNTDKTMVQLMFNQAGGPKAPMGVFNWFAVHPTSMNNTNKLVSGDNKGYASYLMERAFNGPTSKTLPGAGEFVAAFVSTNLGDVSPNTAGPHCRDTGEPCDNPASTCNGKVAMCSSAGPGKDMFESTEIIATKQLDVALALTRANATQLGSGVDFIHTYVKFPGLQVTPSAANPGPAGSLCGAAMGDSFAAGTTDGPGMFNFNQGNTSNPLWNVIGSLLHKASPEQRECQHPKEILLDTGSISFPHPWAPDVLPIQLFRLGQLLIVNVPTELTTMAGRRLRKALKAAMVEHGLLSEEEGTVVISGLANGYADYTTTFEEFQVQRYEGGSTIFGPHQLQGYVQELTRLAVAMATNATVGPGPTPDDFSDKLSKGKGPKAESCKEHAFGDATADVPGGATFVAGAGVVKVTFVGGWPNNNLRAEGTFLEVQRQAAAGAWRTVAVDGDPETRFHSVVHSCSALASCDYHDATVQWFVPAGAAAGTYRIVHHGTYFHKPALKKGELVEYNGTSSTFEVTAAATTNGGG
jgi:neutral ceramidase